MADLETHRPITPDTVFNIGSIAKAFTGMCTALLVQDGLISYDDPIRKFLPGFPEAGDLISIRSILTHTSGIPNYWGHFGLETLWLSRDSDALKGAFDIEFGTVGDMWDYSNPAYNLLGLVVEVVSGTALNRFLTERVFAPLGMVDSFVDEQDTFCASKDATYEETAPPAEVEQSAAIPYDEVDGAYTRMYWPEYIPGSGSILSQSIASGHATHLSGEHLAVCIHQQYLIRNSETTVSQP